MKTLYILTVTCADRPGLVAAVSSALFAADCNIVELQQFNDRDTGRFFMRMVFETGTDAAALQEALRLPAHLHGMSWNLRPLDRCQRVLFLVSKLDHCLGDLLYRARIGELRMDIVGVISNHPRETLNVSILDQVPFHHLPVSADTRPAQEARIKQIVADTGAELVILARYMQILSDDLATCLSGRCINIHHSFLPSFKGARPYHQAHSRGVKMIGATAHYVTADLDEGPIIHQDVERVSHADSSEDLVRKGRNIEQRVLAHAVGLHLQQRVLISGRKTVVFTD